MKKYLLPEKGNDYKSNLHSHSTVSDGKLTPEELKSVYMEKGYSIIAYTDHDYFATHNDLTDEGFLALNGYELAVGDHSVDTGRTCHFCFIARDPDMKEQVCVYPSRYLPDGTDAPFVKKYSPEVLSDMMKQGRDAGFFVTYNHPVWSQERYPQYMSYDGMHAMEIVNFGCLVTGWNDECDLIYDDMLRGGKRIFCLATDDNHNCYPQESRDWDSFGGFTVIRAESLDYKVITDALFAGDFYASEAPLIHELYIEDDRVHITCSPADRVFISTDRMSADIAFRGDEPLTSASFKLDRRAKYIRLTVVDDRGCKAFTNAYFLD